jgi:hypothetical protein
MKVREVERFEGLVAGEDGFVKRKLCGTFTRCLCIQYNVEMTGESEGGGEIEGLIPGESGFVRQKLCGACTQ